MSKRRGGRGRLAWPRAWPYRVALVLAAILLILHLLALAAHLILGARFFTRPGADAYDRALGIVAVLLWGTLLGALVVAHQRRQRLVYEPWQRWPLVARGAILLAVSALSGQVALLASPGTPDVSRYLELVTLLLRAGGCALLVLGLLMGEEPLGDLIRRK